MKLRGEGVDDAELVQTNSANKENAPKAPKEELEKIESVSIETNLEDEEEENPSVAPPVDSTATIPPPSTKPMTEQDREVDWIIDELTRFDNEEEDVPLNLLKMLMRYKMSARKTTCHN
ncbi:hypothetical protein J1N35_044182 [Gossypium stocksii]|uniref:Uncharacterized protein n=1 Tax=Gossypium stocksii TaxID=47602 RepID=A0A9D3U8M8_9ROSI|nr:hypothetical protein J1N35_044182 [Gossypium stocksii]